VKKLFWCFFGGSFVYQGLLGKSLEELSALARNIHFNRLAGLYVEHGEDGLSLPQHAITADDCAALIQLAATPFSNARRPYPLFGIINYADNVADMLYSGLQNEGARTRQATALALWRA